MTELIKESEKFLKNKDVVEINPDEFFKTKPDINKIYKNALKSNFEKHISVVSCISFHYFIKNLFLSTSYDGSLRVYNYTQVNINIQIVKIFTFYTFRWRILHLCFLVTA